MESRLVLQIDGREVEAAPGQSVLEAALAAGVYIPHLCHHPALEPQGGCKLCSVEIEGVDGTVTSCTTAAEAGMVVRTRTDNVTHLRNVATELMLACHPADCTSCAAYLNCELQNLMQYLGVAHSRLRRVEKRNTRLAGGGANPLMKREMERCIQCGRCVRACGGLRGVGALEYRSKDGESYVGVKDDVKLEESDCRFCGACVEVCPTGAIQDMPGVFVADSPREQALVPCKNACPAHTDIPAYVRLAQEARYPEAVAVLREKLTFPHVLGLVCNHKCEADCKRGRLDEPVSIRELKRFAVENDPGMMWRQKVTQKPESGKTVAVVGGGPAGLTAAWHLARKGHRVTVLERMEKTGGMMQYGIPAYRLPRDIVQQEMDLISGMGVEMKTGQDVKAAPALCEEYDAVVVAVGAQNGAPPHLDVAGCGNVWPAVEFCRRASQGDMPPLGGTLTVLGGGNVAFDCARTAKKAGVKQVRVICLEQRGDMLADEEEIAAGLAEGLEILCGRNCVGVERQGETVTGIEAVQVNRFSFGPEGLEMDVEPGSEVLLATDSLILATGQRVDLDESFGLALGRGNTVQVESDQQASLPGVFAAGDAVTGTKSIVEAIASGTRAAAAVDRYLGGDGDLDETYWQREAPDAGIGTVEGFGCMARGAGVCSGGDAEHEAVRCLQCDLRLQIPQVKFWGDAAYQKSRKEGQG